MNDIKKFFEQNKTQILKDRRFLHSIAEVGFELEKTAEYIVSRLGEMGVKSENMGRCGIVAEIGGSGPSVILRADMDALPIMEESALEFAAQNGNMHACGHDLHTAMLLGAAEYLSKNSDKISGRIIFVFQPAEEILKGAKEMLDAGLIEKYKPDCAIMIHSLAAVPLKQGSVVISSGGVSAPSADFFEIIVEGKSAHGSAPADSVDATFVGAQILTSISGIIYKELPPSCGAVLTVGSFSSGNAANVISGKSIMSGTFRAYSDNDREVLRARVCEMSRAIALAHRASVSVNYTSGCPTLINDAALSARVCECVSKLIGREFIITPKDVGRVGGSEDFAYISHRIPSLMIGVTAGSTFDGYNVPLHNPKVVFDERALPLGAAIYAACALELTK